LAVLQGDPAAPEDLRARATLLAGKILELSGQSRAGEGTARALAVLNAGHAWHKFQAICEAQGGLRTPPVASHHHEVVAAKAGRIAAIDNRRLAKVAKLAGAPSAAAAGVDLHVHVGDIVEADMPVLTVHAQAPGELAYALGYLTQHSDLMRIDDIDQETSA
jgi:thymidine phosphorylase